LSLDISNGNQDDYASFDIGNGNECIDVSFNIGNRNPDDDASTHIGDGNHGGDARFNISDRIQMGRAAFDVVDAKVVELARMFQSLGSEGILESVYIYTALYLIDDNFSVDVCSLAKYIP